jgi:hypothetical protein
MTPEEAAPILRDVLTPYLTSRTGRSFLRIGYELTPDASMKDFINEAQRHPGFELRPKLRGLMNRRDSKVAQHAPLQTVRAITVKPNSDDCDLGLRES